MTYSMVFEFCSAWQAAARQEITLRLDAVWSVIEEPPLGDQRAMDSALPANSPTHTLLDARVLGGQALSTSRGLDVLIRLTVDSPAVVRLCALRAA